MRPILPAAATILLALGGPAPAASVSKTYTYFSVGGSTLAEIETELGRRGPHVASTGQRHPGATTMQFKTALQFGSDGRSCRITAAHVSVRAKVTLPSWRRPRSAENSTRLIWDTLAADIKRHEESHVSIAKTAASGMEAQLRSLGRFPDCQAAAARAQVVSQRALEKHDRDQATFDRVESKNFEARLLRLLDARLQRMRPGQGR